MHGRAGRSGRVRPPRSRREAGVAGSAGSRPGSSLPGVALPAVVQPVRRDRGSVRPLHGLRTLARGTAPSRRLSALRSPARGGCTGERRHRSDSGTADGRDRAVSDLPQSVSSVRSGGRTLELRPTVERPHPSHEVPPGPRGGRRARTTPRPRADGSIRLPDARCGDRATAVQAAAPLPRIQPCRGAGRHCPRRAESGTTTEGPHRPAPLAAASQGRKRSGAPRERSGHFHRSPVAIRSSTRRDRGRRADDRCHRVRARGGAPGRRSGTDRSLVLRPDSSCLNLDRTSFPVTLLGRSRAGPAREPVSAAPRRSCPRSRARAWLWPRSIRTPVRKRRSESGPTGAKRYGWTPTSPRP